MNRHTADTVADDLGIHVDTLRRRCAAGVYQHHRSGRVYYFTDDDLAAIEEAEKVPATAGGPPAGRTPKSAEYHSTGRKSRIR
ncbi:hypothetical protein AXK57_22160 [Tsukamurella pulmonis]|uniref:hypothetical protein n=1 Tax=Tsukamurella pulmonis TaxID=47312 RepID=UPI0007977A59|nr:hypothetical protein [Tsukamurella pulmonis]KXP07804.1 hypothetical protein AXK57_22160 [Tsukamurella pulmonis]